MVRITRGAQVSQVGAYVYVDGAYVRAELVGGNQPEWFDPRKPAMHVQNERIAGDQIVIGRVFYYDAADPELSADRRQEQEAYFKAISELPDTHVVLGELRRSAKKREQKGVDVQLAVDALNAALSGVTPVIALVAGDADFAPLARAIREAGPHVFVFAFKNSVSERLRQEADRVHLWDDAPQDWELKN